MDGLDFLGADSAAIKKKAPYIGSGLGALVGALVTAFVGEHTDGLMGRATLFGKSVPRLARIGAGTAIGAAVGGGVGYGVSRIGGKKELSEDPKKKALPGAKGAKK